MAARRPAGRLTPLHVLLVVAFLEVAINRVGVPMLRPAQGVPPRWHTALDYLGLFLFYLAGTLGAVLIAAHVVDTASARRGARGMAAMIALSVAAALASIPLAIASPAALSVTLEVAFSLAVVALVVSGFGRARDLGVQLGLAVLGLPLLVHTVAVLGARYLWPEGTFDGPGVIVTRAAELALAGAALVSPYVFAPRPFARAVTRPAPIVAAMVVAGVGAWLARAHYRSVVTAAGLAIGVELDPATLDPRLALYLLAVATLAWTFTACGLAASPARRQIGLGAALVVLAGYAFRWPHHYLLALLGVALVADAARRVRDEELAAIPLSSSTPTIGDPAWASYVAGVRSGLERALASVHALTTRGDDGVSSTTIVGEADGRRVRIRIDRLDGSVLALDVIVGREVAEVRGATFTLWAIPERGQGANPPAPPAAPPFKAGDGAFDQRFKLRGNRLVFEQMFDEEQRARAVATLDGWLACWERDGIRYRVYPGRGAPLDHPLPLSDLALGRGGSPDRLVSVIELLVRIAASGLGDLPREEPSSLDPREPA